MPALPASIPDVPFDGRPSHSNGPFEGIRGSLVISQSVRYGTDQPVLASNDVGPGVEEYETTGTIRVFGLSLAETLVSDQSSLLITDHPGDGHVLERSRGDLAIDFGRGDDLRQDGRFEAEKVDERLVPLQSLERHQQGSRGVGAVDGVDAAVDPASQVLSQPRDKQSGTCTDHGIGRSELT
jgi:hypothetical protein